MPMSHLIKTKIRKIKLFRLNFWNRTIFAIAGINLIIFCLVSSLAGQGTIYSNPNFERDTSYVNNTNIFSSVDFDSEKSLQTVLSGIQYDSSFVQKKLKKQSQKLTVFGYYRLFLYGRDMQEYYSGLRPYERAYGVGDGYREPMMSMTVLGRPNGKTSFATEFFMLTPYSGSGYQENVFTMNLGINFYGNFRTDHGNFGIRAGGIHWYNLSPFTIGVFQILDRFSVFDRTPWEGVNGIEKYENYYNTGNANAGDLRWNNQAFQGLILNGAKLPGDLNFDLFVGKTQPNGGLPGGIMDPFESIVNTLDAGSVPTYNGFGGERRIIPSIITGGKLGRSFGDAGHYFSYNLLNSSTATDSLGTDHRSYQVHSLEFKVKLNSALLTGEFAGSNYQSPAYDGSWGEALMVKLQLPMLYNRIPFDAQIYQISDDFYNQNGEIVVGSNSEIVNDNSDINLQSNPTGLIGVVGQLITNRRGLNINTGFFTDVLKFNLGWGLAQEIETKTTRLEYYHRVNGLALSRIYNPFPGGSVVGPIKYGPYTRKTSVFRGALEKVRITDVDPATAEARNRLYYASVDLQAKAKMAVGDRSVYLNYLGSYGSAKTNANPIPGLDKQTFLFVQFHELDLYVEVMPGFIMTFYGGFEWGKGGNNTEWSDVSNLPSDQFGQGLGIGFDWSLAENAGLYFRHRWMQFEDKSFTLDKYKGREVTLELKTFF
jgi:hypothetical protein